MSNMDITFDPDIPITEVEQTTEANAPVAANPLDLATVRPGLSKYDAEIAAMVAEAKALEVVDEASQVKAVEIGTKAKKAHNTLEKQRKAILEPAAEFTKTVNALFKGYQGRFAEIESGLKAKIATHQAAVEMERRRKEEAERKAAAELQAKIDAEIAELNAARAAEATANGAEAPEPLSAITVATPVVAPALSTIRTESGTSSKRQKWDFKITDPLDVPREYLAVDEQAIRRAIAAGVRKISGVEIYEATVIAFRA